MISDRPVTTSLMFRKDKAWDTLTFATGKNFAESFWKDFFRCYTRLQDRLPAFFPETAFRAFELANDSGVNKDQARDELLKVFRSYKIWGSDRLAGDLADGYIAGYFDENSLDSPEISAEFKDLVGLFYGLKAELVLAND